MQKISIKSLFIAFIALPLFTFTSLKTFAGPGDTTIVQTFVFGSKQDSTFLFPSAGKSWEKILMYYTLKCNPAQSPACGEWDYQTYTNLHEHTKKLDSTKYMHPNFKVGNSSPDTLKLNNSQTYTYAGGFQYSNQSTMTDSALIGIGNFSKAFPLSSNNSNSRTQYILTAAELNSAGLAAGNLSALRLNLNSNQQLKKMIIRIKQTNLSFLNANSFIDSGFTLMVSKDFTFSASGWQKIPFTYPFTWDGTSNLLIDISYESCLVNNSNLVKCDSLNLTSSVYSNELDRNLKFAGKDYLSMKSSVNAAFASLDSFVTVGVWVYADPNTAISNTTLLEVKNASGTRVLNIHLPWSNSNMYWDAGASGSSYDRINKAMSAQEIKGSWNYWTFTKNVGTGSMKIYKNGALWHSGTGMTKRMKGATTFIVGGTLTSSYPSNLLQENIDELSIWNVELSPTEIQEIMVRKVLPSNPKFANLLCYYTFDETSGLTVNDYSSHSNQLFMSGVPERQNFVAAQRVKNTIGSNFRPQTIIEQGVYNPSTLDSVYVLDSIQTAIIEVILFSDTVHPNTNKATDTIYRYPNKNIYLFNSMGVIYDSISVNPDTILIKSMHPYWGTPFEVVNKYELGRFITPYGNGLDLGTGFTWVYDVTDFTKLLKDSVHLSGGNNQELMDIKFLMIEGTPARNLLDQHIIYSGYYAYTGPEVENKLIPMTFAIKPATKNMNMSITTTGHGMSDNENCAEFCPKTHKIKINDTLAFSQYLFRENCDLNPLYPQGGTWIFSRANWCPGSDVTKYYYELTPWLKNHDSININYDLQPFVWNGAGSQPNYIITAYLFEYGAPNFHNNASIEEIISPNNMKLYGRFNPNCGQPRIVIKNAGSDTLKTLTIEYFVEGGQTQVFNWTGNLAFLASEEVELPAINWTTWNGDKRFTAILKNPNGQTDEYPANNRLRDKFEMPLNLPSSFAFYLKTNSAADETSWELRDASGTLLINKSGFQNDQQYIDTLNLAAGCYTLKVKDAAGDGLKFWYNMPPYGNQTAGTARLRNLSGSYIKILESDFGRELALSFTVGQFAGEEEIVRNNNTVEVFPNPTNGNLTLSFGLESQQDIEAQLLDINGKTLLKSKYYGVFRGNEIVDLTKFPKGIYLLKLLMENEVKTFKIVKD